MIPKMTRAEVKEYTMRSKDVAWILDCSPDDVIEWARKGKLNARKKGRFWRFRLKDAKAMAKKGAFVEGESKGPKKQRKKEV